MTPYAVALTIGGVGLVTMALGGIGRGHGHSGHGLGRSGARALRGARPSGLRTARGAQTHGAATHGAMHGGVREVANALAALASPRVLFSLLVGFGGTGVALTHVLAGPALAGSAILGALGFERIIVAPLWRLMMRFASEPAMTLESCITDEVKAVTSFDDNGQGLVAVELDGQVSQILATLSPGELATGAHVRAGDRLRVEDVDAQRNRCTVSIIEA